MHRACVHAKNTSKLSATKLNVLGQIVAVSLRTATSCIGMGIYRIRTTAPAHALVAEAGFAHGPRATIAAVRAQRALLLFPVTTHPRDQELATGIAREPTTNGRIESRFTRLRR